MFQTANAMMLCVLVHIFVVKMNISNEIDVYKTIGKNIKKYRKQNKIKLTQKELAERVGICTSLIGGLESSNITQGISIYNLYKISKVLNVSINKLLK